MKNEYRHLPDSELEVMQIVWQMKPPVSRFVIEEELNKVHHLAPTTILTLLTRLAEKGFFKVEKDKRTNL